jgi:DNA-binding transcriptional LysR family regulator
LLHACGFGGNQLSVELRHLRYFVAVAEELNFRKAAKRLHIAQPPLGRQIRDLEEEIGTPLFDRSRNHVRLTGAGQVFLAGARETLEAAERAIAGARKATRSAVPVPFRIGKFGSFTASFLSQALSIYKDTHPNVSISLFGMDPQAQLDGLLADQLDLAFVPTLDLLLRRRVAKQIEAQPVLRSPLMVLLPAGHPLAAQADADRPDKAIPLSKLSGEVFLRFSADQNPSYTMHLVRECRRRGKFRPRLGPEGSDHTDLINLVATGEGIMLEAQFLFEEAMARLRSASLAARVVARRVGFPLVELVAAWSKAHPSPLVADFLKTLESVSRLRKGNAGR